jgi:hypothetical protein
MIDTSKFNALVLRVTDSLQGAVTAAEVADAASTAPERAEVLRVVETLRMLSVDGSPAVARRAALASTA